MVWSSKVAKRIDLGIRTETGQDSINSLLIILRLFNNSNMNSKLFGPFSSRMSAKKSFHYVQLDANYADIDKHKDTYDLWALLKKSAVTKGTYNL